MVFHHVSLMLSRHVIMIRVTICLYGKNRQFAHSVYDEKIQMSAIIRRIFQFFFRHYRSVTHNLSQWDVA